MPTNNTPDVTTPTSRTGNTNLGVAGNYGSSPNLNSSNVNVGGQVYNGVITTNAFPVNQSVLAAGKNGGGSSNTESSNNVLGIQNETSNRVTTEVVAQTSYATTDTDATGFTTKMPPSTKQIEYSKVNGYSTITTTGGDYRGVVNNRTYVVDDITRIAEMKTQTVAAGENNKIDGKAKIGDPDVLESGALLPGGVTNSNQIGQK